MEDINLSKINKTNVSQKNNIIETHIIKNTTKIERKTIINKIEQEINEYNNYEIKNNENVNNCQFINNQNELILENDNNKTFEEFSNYENLFNIKSSERTFYKSNKIKKLVYKK